MENMSPDECHYLPLKIEKEIEFSIKTEQPKHELQQIQI